MDVHILLNENQLIKGRDYQVDAFNKWMSKAKSKKIKWLRVKMLTAVYMNI